MGKLICEKNLRDVWCRNESVRAEIGQILQTHRQTHASKISSRDCRLGQFPVLPPFGLMELYLKKGPTPGVGPIFTSNAICILRIETVIVGKWAIVLQSNEASDL